MQKNKEAIFEARFCTRPNANINEMIASSLSFFSFFFFEMKIETTREKTSCAQFIHMKPEDEGVGVVE